MNAVLHDLSLPLIILLTILKTADLCGNVREVRSQQLNIVGHIELEDGQQDQEKGQQNHVQGNKPTTAAGKGDTGHNNLAVFPIYLQPKQISLPRICHFLVYYMAGNNSTKLILLFLDETRVASIDSAKLITLPKNKLLLESTVPE